MIRVTTPRRTRPPARPGDSAESGDAATSPLSAFGALAAVPGLLMASALTVGGIVAWRDPLMRPPKLPNRRPPAWGLPAAGIAYGALVATAARNVEKPLAALALSAAATPGAMLPLFELARRTWARRDRGAAGTVIVLGCALRNGRPSSLLRYRLEAAEKVARRTGGSGADGNPADVRREAGEGSVGEAPRPATVICCGGVGEEDVVSEADVMCAWLRDRGLDDVRAEPRSTSTLENLANAVPMVERGPVTVVTSDFHVFRTRSLARRAGNAAWRVEGAATPPRYWATSILREFLALGTWWPAPGIAVGSAIFGAWMVGREWSPARVRGRG